MKMRFRVTFSVIAAAIAVSAVVAVSPAVAKTKTKPNLSCELTGAAIISPGLSSTPAIQTITVITSLSSCSGSTVPGISSSSPSSTSSTSKKPESCSALGKKSVTKTPNSAISWNNGDTSSDTYKTTLLLGSATVKGKITGGDFKKGKIAATLSYDLGAGQNCTSVPITSATLTGTFNIT